MLIKFAAVSGNGNCVLSKMKTCVLERTFRYQHSVAGFLGAAGLGGNNTKGFVQIRSNCSKNLVHAVRVGVVKEKGLELVGTRITQSVGDELRPPRRPANTNQKVIFARPASTANFRRELCRQTR